MRRFLLHVLPSSFHRIRHYGLLTKVRALLDVPPPEPVSNETAVMPAPTLVCRCCGATKRVVEIVRRRQSIRAPP